MGHWQKFVVFNSLISFLIQIILLILMYIDIVLKLSGKQRIDYVRVIRALRSLFLIDNYLLSGVRRYVRIIV
jgi:hypothetical protein